MNHDGHTTDLEIMNLVTGEKMSLSGHNWDENFRVDFAGLQYEESPVICGNNFNVFYIMFSHMKVKKREILV